MWFWSSVAWTTNRIAHRYVCWLSCVLNCKRVFTCDPVTCVFCPNMTPRCWLCIRHQDWRISQPQLWWAKSLVNSSVHWLLLTTALQCPVVAPARPVSLPNGRLHFDAYVLTFGNGACFFPAIDLSVAVANYTLRYLFLIIFDASLGWSPTNSWTAFRIIFRPEHGRERRCDVSQ